MNKIGLIIGREYFTRVKKKSFLVTTILVPLVIIGFYAAIIAISIKGSDEKQKIAVIDEGNLFTNFNDSSQNKFSFRLIKNETEQSFVKKYKDQGFDGFLYVPAFEIDKPVGFVLHSASSASLATTSSVEKIINKAVRDKRLLAQGLDPKTYEKIAADVDLVNTVDSKDGSKKSVAAVAYIVSFACGILIYMMMIVYGTQVMRGVTEEKTNRIAEVIVSSVKPFQLMMGKITGIGSVGLLQFIIWIVLVFGLQAILGAFMSPDQVTQAGVAGAAVSSKANMVTSVTNALAQVNLPLVLGCFIFYFLGGYFLYSSLFAAVGCTVNEDPQEAQSLLLPITLPIIFSMVIMTKAVNAPNSGLAVFGSIFPLTSPIVMMGRIAHGVPDGVTVLQLIISMVVLVVSFLFTTWMAGKIYRTGILLYGKKASWKEMMRWAFRKA
jgi:ABC-2 type transport system permease protein